MKRRKGLGTEGEGLMRKEERDRLRFREGCSDHNRHVWSWLDLTAGFGQVHLLGAGQ